MTVEESTEFARANALSLSQKRAASLSLLVAMAESASFASEVQTLLDDVITTSKFLGAGSVKQVGHLGV